MGGLKIGNITPLLSPYHLPEIASAVQLYENNTRTQLMGARL